MEINQGRPMHRTQKTIEEIHHSLEASANIEESMLAQIEEMMVMGCLACPKEKTLRQRKKYFNRLRFFGLESMLMHAESGDSI